MCNLAAHVTVISLALAGSAMAADLRMPVKAPPPVAVVAASWTGCYLGAGGGYGMYDQKSQYQTGGVDIGIANDNGGRGWFGTVQVGCDYQVGSNWVIGAFGDWDFGSISGTAAFPIGGLTGEEKLRNSWAAGGRIGWLPFNQLMVYVSAGWTQARFNQVDLNSNGGFPLGLNLARHTYDGYFIGTGYEYALGWAPGLFWKTEYRWSDYGSESVPIIVTATGAATADSINAHKYVQTVRSELVWRFNFGGPVVARY